MTYARARRRAQAAGKDTLFQLRLENKVKFSFASSWPKWYLRIRVAIIFLCLFEKQLGPQESLILGKLFCSPHQSSNVDNVCQDESEHTSISFSRDGNGWVHCSRALWLLSRRALFPSLQMLLATSQSNLRSWEYRHTENCRKISFTSSGVTSWFQYTNPLLKMSIAKSMKLKCHGNCLTRTSCLFIHSKELLIPTIKTPRSGCSTELPAMMEILFMLSIW